MLDDDISLAHARGIKALPRAGLYGPIHGTDRTVEGVFVGVVYHIRTLASSPRNRLEPGDEAIVTSQAL